MQKSKYMLASERDAQWGLTVSTVGFEVISPGDPYPTKGHADGYYFNVEKGRVLNEYQLLYNTAGEGTFESTVSGGRLKVVDGRNICVVAVRIKRNDRDLVSGFPVTVESGHPV